MITSFNVFVPAVMGAGSSLQTGIRVKGLGCKKVLVVYDKGLKDIGIADKILDNLNVLGIETVSFDKVLPDPPDVIVIEGADLAKAEGVDGIVAVGGGSAMDAAKGINVLMNNPPPLKRHFGIRKHLKPGLPMVFIPTTSGTGSEVTNMCVITRTDRGTKDSIIAPPCIATLAILDPELTVGLPPKMTAATGIDALSHAVESLTGGNANPMSDALAREAVRAIVKWLPVAYKDGKNIEAREQMILASMYAGMAFTNAFVHLGHSIGHVLGANFHIAHGLGCAAALPEVIEIAAKSEWKKVAMICECFGATVPQNASPEEIGTIARNEMRKFFKSIDIPNMKQQGLNLEEILKVAPKVPNDASYGMAPYRVSVKKIEEILTKAYDA